MSDATPRPGELDVEVARWLVSDEGLDAVADATAGLDAGRDPLAIATRLADAGVAVDRRSAVTAAAVARRRARARWPDADELLFTREGLEQASDPDVSAWRARRFPPVADAVEDRAAGTGGDTLALAAAGLAVTALDLDAARLVLLGHNAAVRGHEVRTVVGDAIRTPATPGVPIHVDPARRIGERRVRRLREHRPSVPDLLDHLTAARSGAGVAVVLSPAVDTADPDLPTDAELEFVQRGPDLVEAVAWTGALRRPGTSATATLLDRGGRCVAERSRGARGPTVPVGPIGDVLIEVAPAAVRARLHDELAAEAGARRIARRRAVLTADGAVPASPWWRARPVAAVLALRPTAVRRWLREADDRPVELVRHGVDTDLDAFRRAIGSPRGGPDGWRLELVRTDAGAEVVVTDARA